MPEEKFRWDERRFNDNQAFREALNNTKLREDVLNDHFAETLAKRKVELDRRTNRSYLLLTTVSLMLGVSLIAVGVPISIFGMSTTDASRFREVLLLLLASIPLYGLMNAIELSRLSDMLTMWCNKRAGGNYAVLQALRLQYGLGPDLQASELKDRSLSRSQGIGVLVYGFGLIIWFLLLLGVLILVEVAAIISILRNPTVSLTFSIFVTFYVLCASAANFGVRSMVGLGTNARAPDNRIGS